MGKLKRLHNKKGRLNNPVAIDNTEAEKIKINIPDLEKNEYDASNLLVLPSKKRKTKKLDQNRNREKVLSKKQLKKLQNLLEKKTRKQKSQEIIQALGINQVPREEQELFVSISHIQTKGLKRQLLESRCEKAENVKINSIYGSSLEVKKRIILGANDVPMESSDSLEMSEDDDEEDIKAEEKMEDGESDNKDGVEDGENDKKANKERNEDTKCMEVEANKTDIALAKKLAVVSHSAGLPKKPVVYVPVNRTPEIQEARLKLPILAEEQLIMETISENPITILCGETGSGKTTQVPQFLYEAGYASGGQIIGITEPRRVAAISMSNRVATEMALSSKQVSYQIRYEGNTTKDTMIKFMTDGVLLKEVERDFLLTRYSVIIIDEAHERSVFTDILIGLLSRIVPLRNKRGNSLKLIIMSATLRVEDFTQNTRLFAVSPPVVKVETRQHNVDIHFNKRTPGDDYLNEAFKKVSKIHRTLPAGGILVFVTGQQEVQTLCRKLRKLFSLKEKNVNSEKVDDEKNKKKELRALKKMRRKKSQSQTVFPEIDLDNYSVNPLDEEMALLNDEDLPESDEEIFDDDETSFIGSPDVCEPLYILPLYSLLPSHKQTRVFELPPDGTRLCVVATNIAETSLTIPNIKYVVDTGKVKKKFYDKVTGVSTFRITWASKASAAQRAGRAGRTSSGHCYRLYSSAVFNNEFVKFSEPEITQRPVDDLVLQLKAIGISDVVNFPFPTAPQEIALKMGETRLISLGALELTNDSKDSWTSKITPLGKTMSYFPVAPRYAKMLALGDQHNLMPFIICLVAALSVQEVFLEGAKNILTDTEQNPNVSKMIKFSSIRRMWVGEGYSLLLGDLMALLKAVGAFEYEGCRQEFCQDNGLRHKAMIEIRKLRKQLTEAVNTILPNADLQIDPKMSPPSDLEAKLLQQIVLSASGDFLAKKIPESNLWNAEEKSKWRHAYQCPEMVDPVYISPQSVLFREKPEYVIYQELFETSKVFMRNVSAVEPKWIPVYVKKKCTFSKPLESPSPRYDELTGTVKCHMNSTFGHACWSLPPVEFEYPSCVDKYKWFACFFLEGHVCPLLEQFNNNLLSPPKIMLKSWARLHQRTEIILKALMWKEVDSKESLLRIWETDKKFLLSSYSYWLPEELHGRLSLLWPPSRQLKDD